MRWLNLIAKNEDWRPWFAWHPVLINEYWYWGVIVERRLFVYNTMFGPLTQWQYRPHGEDDA